MNLSYPIIVGNDILSESGEILKDFISKKKIIVVQDNFFSINNNTNNIFKEFIKSIKKSASSVKLIDISIGISGAHPGL